MVLGVIPPIIKCISYDIVFLSVYRNLEFPARSDNGFRKYNFPT